MSERQNPTWEETRERLHADDPELAAAYAESEPAYLVAREVIRARAELGISQAELARRMETSQSVISRLENMEGSPNLKTVLALAKALDRKVELRFVGERTGDDKPDAALGFDPAAFTEMFRQSSKQMVRLERMLAKTETAVKRAPRRDTAKRRRASR